MSSDDQVQSEPPADQLASDGEGVVEGLEEAPEPTNEA